MPDADNYGNPDYPAQLAEMARVLQLHRGPIAIASHVDADGDAVGSVLGLQRALRALGKPAQAFLRVPNYLAFLPEAGEVSPPRAQLEPGTLLVVLDVDSSDPLRVEGVAIPSGAELVLNLDHHGTNSRRADLSIVEPGKAATCQLVKELVDSLGVPWTADIATPVLLGLVTDTGSFRFMNTNGAVLRCAAELVEWGASLSWINNHLSQQPKSHYALLVSVLSSMEFHFSDLVVSAQINQAMLDSAGAGWEEAEAFVNTIRSAQGTELAVLFKDYGDNVKISLRSRGRVSAQAIAVACGGGGHHAAAGATLNLPYLEARATVLGKIEEQLQIDGLR
jgi:phosphoesterase RecJ-like protein